MEREEKSNRLHIHTFTQKLTIRKDGYVCFTTYKRRTLVVYNELHTHLTFMRLGGRGLVTE